MSLEPSPATLPYADAATPRGFVVERGPDGVVVTLPPLHAGRRIALAASAAIAVAGPIAAAFMIAAGFGWVLPLVGLAVILAPAVALRLASASGERAAPGGPDAVFRIDADCFEITVRNRGDAPSMRWRRAEVDIVRAGWFGSGLAIRVGGRVEAEVLHGHPLRVRARVAEVLNRALHPSRHGTHDDYNPHRADRRSPSRRRAGPVL
jgi:hypothetical protein